ncbi:MAG: transcription termination factor Rho [Gemmatimonadetes bacterium]|nr:transcription termination factor Rho [Gemmatimonadota bacterium]
MNERRPPRRGRAKRPKSDSEAPLGADGDPYLPATDGAAPQASASPEAASAPAERSEPDAGTDARVSPAENGNQPKADAGNGGEAVQSRGGRGEGRGEGRGDQQRGGGNGQQQGQGGQGGQGGHRGGRRGRRNRRGRHRSGNDQQTGAGGGGGGQSEPAGPPPVIVPDGTTEGWFDPSREAGFVRRAVNSYLADPGDAYVGPHLVREFGLRRGDQIIAATGNDHRGRSTVAELTLLNGDEPVAGVQRTEFQALTASYPERHLRLETGRPAKAGPELTRRCIDLIAPIGYGQRALIVAPARAGKTMLLHAITEGIALNHPEAVLLILLVDERPEEVSEAISWEVGEVVASSFDQPAKRHVEVVEMVLERARRMVELGKDVVIVLDSLTRMARAFNTAERGTGRTLSGGLDSSAMARPKAFFGSARSILPENGGGSITIIATALVETGSRMDDVIFEEFKGTGNCEIKLDRSLSEKRIFPAFDIATSGTRREEKLYREDQLQAIYMLRRGLQQMPPSTAMEWLIKRIAATTNNEALLAGL